MPVETLSPTQLPTGAARLSIVRCAGCGETLDDRTARATCLSCGGLLAVEHAPQSLSGAALRTLFDDRLGPAAPRLRQGSGQIQDELRPLRGGEAGRRHVAEEGRRQRHLRVRPGPAEEVEEPQLRRGGQAVAGLGLAARDPLPEQAPEAGG